MPVLVSLLLVLLAAIPGGKALSYRSLTREDAARDFYREAGSGWKGKLVHVHVPAKRILGSPSRLVPKRGGGHLHVYENQSVPLVVDPDSIYFKKIRDRVIAGDRVCVKGEVKPEPTGGKNRLALWVHKLKRGHDAATGAKGGGRSSKPKSATAKR